MDRAGSQKRRRAPPRSRERRRSPPGPPPRTPAVVTRSDAIPASWGLGPSRLRRPRRPRGPTAPRLADETNRCLMPRTGGGAHLARPARPGGGGVRVGHAAVRRGRLVSQAGCRTPLTYYGGKQRLAGRIVALMPAPSCLLGAVRRRRGGALPKAARHPRDAQRPRQPGHAVLAARCATAPTSSPQRSLRRRTPGQNGTCAVSRPTRSMTSRPRIGSWSWIDQSFRREGTGWSPRSVRLDRRGRWQAGVWANLPDKLAAAADRLAGVALEHRPNRTSAPSPLRSRAARRREGESDPGPRQPDARDWADPSVRSWRQR
jgi:hypothetical protein